MRLLSLCFLWIEAEDVPSPSLAITDNHLLGLQVVGEGGETTGLREYLVLYFSHRRHAGGEQVFAAGPGKFFPVSGGIHARVGNKQCSTEVPASQVLSDALDRGYIRSVTGKDPAFYRQPLTGNRQGDHDLRRPGALLGVAVLTQTVVFVGIVFIINGE